MAHSFTLPDLGEGVHEGEIVAVLVSVGEEVKEDQPILEVETDKATVEIPSPYQGVVSEVRVKAGDVARVGDVLITFTEAGEQPAPPPQPAAPAVAPAAPAPREPQPEKAPPTVAGGPVPATPATRRLARELGVDLHQVAPTGPGGRVTDEDVRAAAAGAPAAPIPAPAEKPAAEPEPEVETVEQPALAPTAALPDFARWGRIERLPLRSIRRATARQMALSWAQIPHVHHQDVADITELDAFRKRYKNIAEEQGGKLTLTVIILKAAVAALKALPRFNASLDTVNEEIVLKQYYHLGVAVDTERGLMVPVIRDVDRKSLIELSIELDQLVQRVRGGKASPEELRGGTFTVTNVGSLGGTGAAPIINYPEAGILALGAARMQPVVQTDEDGEYRIVPRLLLPLILGFDHRVADGVEAARFIRLIIDILEQPDKLALHM